MSGGPSLANSCGLIVIQMIALGCLASVVAFPLLMLRAFWP